ncbi:hypothetical protein Pfo_011483, partial [Paulownia fortunei]
PPPTKLLLLPFFFFFFYSNPYQTNNSHLFLPKFTPLTTIHLFFHIIPHPKSPPTSFSTQIHSQNYTPNHHTQIHTPNHHTSPSSIPPLIFLLIFFFFFFLKLKYFKLKKRKRKKYIMKSILCKFFFISYF